MSERVYVIGGGLAGSEAAWQIAEAGHEVDLFEMRPMMSTGAHETEYLAELVCSNSFGSQLPDRASGILMQELDQMGSLLLSCAREARVPAGSALAVDRVGFAQRVTQALESHPRIEIRRMEVKAIPDGPAVLATGPLTSAAMSATLAELTGEAHLYFFDALAPIVERESIDMQVAFRGSRYGRGELEQGDYINCPFTKQEYDSFVEALLLAERIPLRSFEQAIEEGVMAGAQRFFEGCLPIEVIAQRGQQALAYGPMRPVGLTDPRTERRPYAALQLRQDDLAGDLYNLVGFQTNLTFPEQRRVLRMIPGLEKAVFIRYGMMHRNTFINAPRVLHPSLQVKGHPHLFMAGQITGVEGYLGNVATGVLAGINLARSMDAKKPLVLPQETMLGALLHYVAHAEAKQFQPMKANLGLMPALTDGKRRNRRERAAVHAERAKAALKVFLAAHNCA